eukprot:TRINITY_DN14982_c0_g1_i1.p1 TRINITY_DN14982_c0_g1~~TRINITY_DN14982_c0_g1_i1.p1  ORF type:complete len:200 (-),score=0.94 TRINITY_DN14982_c0_g1_i1:75-674(-)
MGVLCFGYGALVAARSRALVGRLYAATTVALQLVRVTDWLGAVRTTDTGQELLHKVCECACLSVAVVSDNGCTSVVLHSAWRSLHRVLLVTASAMCSAGECFHVSRARCPYVVMTGPLTSFHRSACPQDITCARIQTPSDLRFVFFLPYASQCLFIIGCVYFELPVKQLALNGVCATEACAPLIAQAYTRQQRLHTKRH